MFYRINSQLTLADALNEYEIIEEPRYKARILYADKGFFCGVGSAHSVEEAQEILDYERGFTALEGAVLDTWTANDVYHVTWQTQEEFDQTVANDVALIRAFYRQLA
jgi:hypothetical protein